MRRAVIACLIALLTAVAGDGAAAQTLQTEEQKTLYALGLAMSRNLANFNLTEAELELVKAGLTDGVLKKTPQVDLQVYGPKLRPLQQARATAAAAAERKAGQSYLDKAAGEKGASKTASGAIVTVITPGTGATPKATDTVKVHYHGTLTDGTVFDSSVQRKEPVTFALNRVIRCWTEAVPTMKVGGRSKLVCPPDTAYGDRGSPPAIKPGATLVFEVELLEIVKE